MSRLMKSNQALETAEKIIKNHDQTLIGGLDKSGYANLCGQLQKDIAIALIQANADGASHGVKSMHKEIEEILIEVSKQVAEQALDGLHGTWQKGDSMTPVLNGNSVSAIEQLIIKARAKELKSIRFYFKGSDVGDVVGRYVQDRIAELEKELKDGI